MSISRTRDAVSAFTLLSDLIYDPNMYIFLLPNCSSETIQYFYPLLATYVGNGSGVVNFA